MFKYEAVADDIQSKILSGFYKPDEKLPQEMELCKQYDTSRITIRQAMELLVGRGLITKRRGSGTFVKVIAGGPDRQEGFAKSRQCSGFSKDNEGHKVTSDVHELSLIPASKDIAERLQIAEGAFVCYICRTRLADDVPRLVEYTYMPTDFITGITMEVVQSSIYSYIQDTLKLKVQSAHRVVRASMPTDDERRWLNINDDPIPIFEIEQIAYLSDGRIFEYSKSRYRADCFELHTVSVSNN